MHARFYAPVTLVVGEVITLPAEEAAHATRVLRLQAGDSVRVFDGRGREFVATIARSSKAGVEVHVDEPCSTAAERHIAVTLAQAVLKGDKMDDVVRDAVMMGVASIVPLITERSEVSAVALQRGHRRARWERIAVVSAKQCGRAVVPPIEVPATLRAFCENSGHRSADRLMFVEPAAAESGGGEGLPATAPSTAAVIVGPEGGWSPEELAMTMPLVSHVTLRGPTLRADAMPLAALAALFAKWDEL